MSQVSPDTVIFTDFQWSLCEMRGVLLWRSLKNGNSDSEWGKEAYTEPISCFPKTSNSSLLVDHFVGISSLLLWDYKSIHIAFIHRWENQGTGQVGRNWDHTSSKREGLCFQTAVYREVRVVGCESPDKTAPAAHPELRLNFRYWNTQLDSQNILAWLYFLQFFCEFLIFFLCLM